MTEQEWRACTDPSPMLDFVRGKVSERKLGLFVSACCQRLLGDLPYEATRLALTMVEQIADGRVKVAERGAVRVPVGQAVISCGASDPIGPLVLSGKDGPIRFDLANQHPLLTSVLERLACWGPNSWQSQRLSAAFTDAGLPKAGQAFLLRDVVRGMFRPLLFRASWRTHGGGVCRRIAQAIYTNAAFHDLPILADALEDSGCDNMEILSHLRGPGPHVRGCWVLDLVLGKC